MSVHWGCESLGVKAALVHCSLLLLSEVLSEKGKWGSGEMSLTHFSEFNMFFHGLWWSVYSNEHVNV